MGFSRQEYWSGLACPLPGHLPKPGIKPLSPVSPILQADSLLSEPPGKPVCVCVCVCNFHLKEIIFIKNKEAENRKLC